MKKQLKSLFILPILAFAVLGGLLIPRLLFSQASLPLLGTGALHKVEIIDNGKCNTSITAWESSIKGKTVDIRIPENECDRASGIKQAHIATLLLQEALETCQPLSSLPDDDPDKKADPSIDNPQAKSLKWRVRSDDTYLCSRPVTVKVTWDGLQYSLEWRSTNAG